MTDWYCYNAGTAHEHLHQYSVCDPALEILAEVSSVHPVEDWWELENNYSFQRAPEAPWKSLNNQSLIVFIDCSLFLLG